MVVAGNSITQIMLGSFVFIAILYLWDWWGEIVVVLGKVLNTLSDLTLGKNHLTCTEHVLKLVRVDVQAPR